MAILLPPLPYDLNAFEPNISAEAMAFHYHKHHADCVSRLNQAVKDTYLNKQSVEELISTSSGDVLFFATEVFNHSFFWQSIHPNGGGPPNGLLATAIEKQWGSYDDFKASFNDKAMENFGSSWTWLVEDIKGELVILNTQTADTPLIHSHLKPLLVIDLWEHAYYIDHRHNRSHYLDTFWKLVNWPFAADNFVK
jgi:Fe-Mn family superoxide dismutase